MTPAEKKVRQDQIYMGFRSAEPIAVQRAKDKVVEAAMRWARYGETGRAPGSFMDWAERKVQLQFSLERACGRLAASRRSATKRKGNK